MRLQKMINISFLRYFLHDALPNLEVLSVSRGAMVPYFSYVDLFESDKIRKFSASFFNFYPYSMEPLFHEDAPLELFNAAWMRELTDSHVHEIVSKKSLKFLGLQFCEKLMAEGKEVYLVDLQDKDPSEMGFENFTRLIQKTVPLTYYNLMEQKLSL